MKLRLRYQDITQRVDYQGSLDVNLNEFSEQLFISWNNHFNDEKENKLKCIPAFSFNGISIIPRDTKFSDAGIVHGDLLHIMSTEKTRTVSPDSNTNEHHPDLFIFFDDIKRTSAVSSNENMRKAEKTENKEMHNSQKPSSANKSLKVEPRTDFQQYFPPSALFLIEKERLIPDASKSTLFKAILAHGSSPVDCASDLLTIVIHILMIETGYVPMREKEMDGIKNDWVSGSHYILNYHHNLCGDKVYCRLTLTTMMNELIIHASLPISIDVASDGDKCIVKSLSISRYIKFKKENPLTSVHNICHLNQLVKNDICYPMLNAMRIYCGFTNEDGLFRLPSEILIQIGLLLDPLSLCRWALTSKVCYRISRDNYIWRRLFLLRFGPSSVENLSSDQNWFELYRDKHLKEKKQYRVDYHLLTRPPYIDSQRSFIWEGIPNFSKFPGIIGGDYDLFLSPYHQIPEPSANILHGLPHSRPFAPTSIPSPRLGSNFFGYR